MWRLAIGLATCVYALRPIDAKGEVRLRETQMQQALARPFENPEIQRILSQHSQQNENLREQDQDQNVREDQTSPGRDVSSFENTSVDVKFMGGSLPDDDVRSYKLSTTWGEVIDGYVNRVNIPHGMSADDIQIIFTPRGYGGGIQRITNLDRSRILGESGVTDLTTFRPSPRFNLDGFQNRSDPLPGAARFRHCTMTDIPMAVAVAVPPSESTEQQQQNGQPIPTATAIQVAKPIDTSRASLCAVDLCAEPCELATVATLCRLQRGNLDAGKFRVCQLLDDVPEGGRENRDAICTRLPRTFSVEQRIIKLRAKKDMRGLTIDEQKELARLERVVHGFTNECVLRDPSTLKMLARLNASRQNRTCRVLTENEMPGSLRCLFAGLAQQNDGCQDVRAAQRAAKIRAAAAREQQRERVLKQQAEKTRQEQAKIAEQKQQEEAARKKIFAAIRAEEWQDSESREPRPCEWAVEFSKDPENSECPWEDPSPDSLIRQKWHYRSRTRRTKYLLAQKSAYHTSKNKSNGSSVDAGRSDKEETWSMDGNHENSSMDGNQQTKSVEDDAVVSASAEDVVDKNSNGRRGIRFAPDDQLRHETSIDAIDKQLEVYAHQRATRSAFQPIAAHIRTAHRDKVSKKAFEEQLEDYRARMARRYQASKEAEEEHATSESPTHKVKSSFKSESH